MPKTRFKRLLSMVLTLCMVLTMMSAMTLPVFAANGKADTVVFPGNQHLDEDYPLLNKDGKKERSGPKKELDGINYIAHLDVSTGTLTLWNYEGGTIYSRLGKMVPGPKDMIVVLKGDNIIDGSLYEETGGNITITTVGDERASLKIQYHRENNSVDQPLKGIWNNNDNSEITISGKADISIDVENTGNGTAFGIVARNGFTVRGDVNLDIKAKSTGVSTSGSNYGIFTRLGDIVIDTTGDVSIDTSGVGGEGYSYPGSSDYDIKLDNAKTLVLKWTKEGKNGLAYLGNLIYDENNYYVNDEEAKRTLSIFKKQAGKNFVQVVKGSGTGLYWPGETVNIVADPGPADYICQWKVRSDSDVASVGFANENAASTSFIMPNGDVKVEAYYTIFDKQAKFTKIDENTGEITWSTIKPTVKIYIFRMDDETQAWVHHNSLFGPNLGIGNKSHQASRDYNPDGIYKLRVYLEDDSILDSEFQINWGEVPTVDKTGLVSAIAAANTNKGTAVVSTDGTDIDPSEKWVTQAEMDAYTDAISTAQALADKTDANQTEVDNAATALNTATITFNSAKKAGIKVTIEVTKVTISPKTTEVQKGTTAQFTASVEGTGSYDKTVTWSVYGNNDANTTISSSGILTVDAGETATSLTVTATSNGNSSIRDDATVTVSDIPITTYIVTVNNGLGSGDYPAGATVSITAGSPPVGQEFDRWVSSDVTLANENATTTTFEMPANHVTITATYKDLPLTEYTITVQDDGNGVGSANPSTAVVGTEINLTATANTGYKFKEWEVISGGVTIVGNKFTMPDNDVVIKAIFEKEEITPPVTTYTVTINGSYATTTGAGKYAKDTTVTIHAGSRSNYRFNGWTSSDGISFANANSATTSFTMPDKPVTVIANWSYTGGGGSSGGSSGGSTSPTKPTIPTADGTVKVEYSTSNGTASLLISNTRANEIIAKAKNREAVLDLESVKNITGVNIPKNALSSFEKADLDLVVKLPEGTATIDNEALASILDQSTGTADMKLELKEVSKNSLSLVQKESVRKDDLVFDINILMSGKKITEFDGKLTINVPYDGELPVAVWYLNHKGELEKLESRYRNGLVSFTLNHLSLYVVGKDKIEEEIELETKWINPFTDVQENSWFYEAVKYVYENDLMKGTVDKLFSPNEATTRGMIVTILHRLEGLPLAKQGSFTDVKADKYYANPVAWAAENKIVNGYGKDKFGPEDPITREQLAAILMNYAKYKGYDVSAKADLGKYEDSKGISNWARDAMSWANAEGLIQGDGNKLIPTGNATRAQVAAILSRFVDKIIK